MINIFFRRQIQCFSLGVDGNELVDGNKLDDGKELVDGKDCCGSKEPE